MLGKSVGPTTYISTINLIFSFFISVRLLEEKEKKEAKR